MAATAFRRSLRRALHPPARPAVIAPSTPHPLLSLRRQLSRPSSQAPSLNAYLTSTAQAQGEIGSPTALNQKPFPTPHPLLSLRRELSRPFFLNAYLYSTAQGGNPAVEPKADPMAKKPAVQPTAKKPEPMAKNPAVDLTAKKLANRPPQTLRNTLELLIGLYIFYDWIIHPLLEIWKVWRRV